MKLFRRTSALVMVLALLLSLSISVWAVDYDAASMDDLWTAFNDDSGEDVNVNLTADIDGTAEDGEGHYGVSVQEGITYNVGSENGSSLSNVFIMGEGTVVVDVAASGSITVDMADATFNQGIDGELSAYESNVTVEGDVANGMQVYNADVAVSGDVGGYVSVGGDVNGGVDAWEDASVTVGGDVNGYSGNPDNVDYDDPYGFSDGGNGVWANDNATVTVGGDVNGGDAYGTYGWAGSGIDAMGNATVTVGGNVTGGSVTADPDTITDETSSQGGTGIYMNGSASVTVDGDVTAGSTNGSNGFGGNGIVVYANPEAEAGSLTVGGSVQAGEGTVESETADLIVVKDSPEVEAALPSIVVGSVDNVEVYGYTEEEAEQIKTEIDANTVKVVEDTFWETVIWKLYKAAEGEELTVNAGHRTMLTGSVLKAVRESGVKLTIQWNGGEDIVIDKDFTEDLRGYVLLTDLAEMLKK